MNNLNRYGYHLDTFDIHFTDDEESIYDGIFKRKKVQVLVTGKKFSQLTQLIDTYRAQGMEIVAIAYGKSRGSSESSTLPTMHCSKRMLQNLFFQKVI